jgi:membrane peptidoglycan carboxypeptidase
VSPLELARAYATFANGGNRLDITAIRRVDFLDGHSVQLDSASSNSLFKDGETYAVTKILQQNMKHGTGKAAQMGCPAAGKTGTTDTFKDAWFAGYTPRVSTVVWVGYPHHAIPMTNVHGIKVAGATFPAQIWHDYMATAKGGFCGKFPKPTEPAKLKPFCGRLAATKNCAPPPAEGSGQTVPSAPVKATGGAPQPTEAAPVPVPDTVILGGPPSQTVARSAVFRFKSQGAASQGFQCSVDAGPFAGCKSPATFGHLSPGDHVFTVRAVSRAGHPDDSPASFHWSVFDDLAPQRTQTQPAPSPQPQPKQQSPPVLIG